MKHPGAIIRELQVTEKGARLAEDSNQYHFKVAGDANKIDIKRAVEEMFAVSVDSVNTMNYTGKKKRLRSAHYGKRADWKRAVVTLTEGSKIELI